MAGHSQWANIKHRKEAQDAKKGKLFQKLARQIMVAAKSEPNPELNPSLKAAIEKAKRENMPKDNINKLLKKLLDKNNNENYDQVYYEGYGPYNIAIIVETLTNNRNRTAANIRSYFNKFKGSLAVNGAVSFLFEKKGILIFENNNYNEEEIWTIALTANATNVIKEDNQFIIETNVNDFINVKNEFEKHNINQFLFAEITYIAPEKIQLNNQEKTKFLEFIDVLEDDDDVQNIFHNYDNTN